MQQLVPQVGLNPSQGTLLPRSGECYPHTSSGLRQTPDPDWEGQAPRLPPGMGRQLQGQPWPIWARGGPDGALAVAPQEGMARRLGGLVIQGGLGASTPGEGGPGWFLRPHSLPQTSALVPSPR